MKFKYKQFIVKPPASHIYSLRKKDMIQCRRLFVLNAEFDIQSNHAPYPLMFR
jgi:hypothetical protein